MKVHELLNETVDEDRAIVSLSSALYPKLISAARENPKGAELGKISDIVDTPLVALGGINVGILPKAAFYRKAQRTPSKSGRMYGVWVPDTNEVFLNMEYLDDQLLRKALTHELRHALDDIKSDYRTSDDNRYTTHPAGYLSQPDEINARFLESMHMALLKLKRLKQNGLAQSELTQQLPGIIDHAFRANKITAVKPERYSDRDYKRLASRAYQLLTRELEYLYTSH